MKKMSVLKFEILSTIFIFILGVLLHFTFSWSGNNVFVGIFSAVNESVWEHLKLIFYPMLITTILGTIYFKEKKNYLCFKTKGILLACLFIIVFYYTYTSILGDNFTFLDISSFFVAVIIGQIYAYKKINVDLSCNRTFSLFILIVLVILFTIFTFFPPNLELFKDPVTGLFGIIDN